MESLINNISITDFPVDYLKMDKPFAPNTVNIVAMVESENLGFGFFFMSKDTFNPIKYYSYYFI